jgi:putative lysine transport system permease protein
MRKVLNKVILFALVFGIIITIFPKANAEELNNDSTENEVLNDAIQNLKFYSSFNYQTLTQDKLNKLTSDFYLPVEYFGVTISYIVDSEYLSVSEETEIILLRQGTSTIEKEVLKVTVTNLPNIIKGEQEFLIQATLTYLDDSITYNYQGFITPVIPDDFFGGAIYTLVRYAKMFLEGAGLTLLISLVGTVLGFILALFLATAKIIAPTPQDKILSKSLKIFFNKLSSIYITVFRGTPMIVQASFFWYGFGLFGNALLCGLFVVSLNTAAYIAEIIRGSVNAIDKGQTEGSLALGLSYSQTFIFVIFPQAIKNSMPAIGNEFVINIKDTAVLSVIGIFELFNQTKKITSLHYRQLEAYAIVALIYLILTYSITSILKVIEKRMGMKPLELTSSN